MEIYEITGFKDGVSREGVNYLQPADSFQNIYDGYIYRQILQSRKGFKKWSEGYDDGLGGGPAGHLPTRVMGIFQNILTLTSTTQALIFDQNFAYKYDEATNTLIRIPFGGSLAAYAGFGLAQNEDYISGTTYPDKDGKNRFVFTGKGMDHIFFYDGINILDFTDNVPVTGDNPAYEAFVSSGGGVLALTKATHVFWFGERLNFVAPVLAGKDYPQGMLFSAIRNADGNGDKFNTSGSGLLEIDNYELIKGAKILGDKLVFNVSQSNWIIEKTRDVFNPYYSRKVPSVLGTDGSFSSVSWNDEVRSIGRTGILSTDGRQSLRVDNKIPYFTFDEIETLEFEQTYGGFDRNTAQFLWAYVDSAGNSSTQDRVLAGSYEENSWSIYNQRFSCFGETILGQNLTWEEIFEDNNPAWASWDTTEEIWNKVGIGKETQKTLAGDDLGFVYELNVDYDDYYVAITGITLGATTIFATKDHALQVGDTVVVDDVVGTTQLNGAKAIVTAVTIDTVTVNIDSISYTAWDSGGSISKTVDFYAETVPFNPYRENGLQCRISHIEFLIDNNGGSIELDIFMDGEQSPFKSDILIKPGVTFSNNITAIDVAGDPAIEITTPYTKGIRKGDLVTFSDVGGTTELNGGTYSVSKVTSTTFEVQQAGASAFTINGTWTYNKPRRKEREWIAVEVNNTADFMVLAMKQESVSDQVRLTSIRIHCEPAGMTTD